MTRVITVRDRDRRELEADPNFVYVGRAVPRKGWRASPWGNVFFDATLYEKYARRYLKTRDVEILFRSGVLTFEQARILASGLDRLAELSGRVLGCWCCDWKPGDPIPGCHAVVLARLVDELFPNLERIEA